MHFFWHLCRLTSRIKQPNTYLLLAWNNGISGPAHFAAAVLSKAVLASRTRVMQLGRMCTIEISATKEASLSGMEIGEGI